MSLSIARPTRAAFLDHLKKPDIILDEHGQSEPIALSIAAITGLIGAGLYGSLIAVGLSLSSASGNAIDVLPLIAVPPLTALLTFPPLYLVCALGSRSPSLRSLIGVACSGPLIAGTALGAASPLVLLYLLTGELNAGFWLLCLALLGLAVGLGGIGARRNARRCRSQDPGRGIVIGHYLLTLWTALVLSIHLV